MFFDPARTGLLVLGASNFQEHSEELNRRVFLNARNGVLSYFMNPRVGPGLARRNIFDGFDWQGDKSSLMTAIETHLERRSYDDLFVYICSHGRKDGSFFCFRLPSSMDDDPDTFCRFETLNAIITDLSAGRVYYVVDACYSGLIHEGWEKIPPLSAEALQYYSGIRADLVPPRGACILTANGPKEVGVVTADDEYPEIDLPLFTHEMLSLLKSGFEEGDHYGLSLKQLQHEIDRRITLRLLADKKWVQGQARPDKPHVTDRAEFEHGRVGLLSRLYLFQNNHKAHALATETARRFRGFYARLERKSVTVERQSTALKIAHEEISQLRVRIFEQDLEIVALKEKLSAAETMIEKTSAALGRLSSATKVLAFLLFLTALVIAGGILWLTGLVTTPL